MLEKRTSMSWHITIGTHGSRLHGDDRPTVDRQNNELGTPFLYFDRTRADYERELLRGPPVVLSKTQRLYIEELFPAICDRGRWQHIISAAPPAGDHFHILLSADRTIHGTDIRKWLKRWLSQALTERFDTPACGEWWAHGGSTKAVDTNEYYANALRYIRKQRTTG